LNRVFRKSKGVGRLRLEREERLPPGIFAWRRTREIFEQRFERADAFIRFLERDERFRVVPGGDQLDLAILAYADARLRRFEAAATDALPRGDRVRRNGSIVRVVRHFPHAIPRRIKLATRTSLAAYDRRSIVASHALQNA